MTDVGLTPRLAYARVMHTAPGSHPINFKQVVTSSVILVVKFILVLVFVSFFIIFILYYMSMRLDDYFRFCKFS